MKVLHRDARCIVVDKPTGVATHRGWADDDDALLQQARDAAGAYVYPVHRLDRGASGVVLFALDREAAAAFARAWEGADKRYLALVRGKPPDAQVIDHAIPRAPRSGKSSPGEARVPAVTEIRCVERYGRYALVEARLRTGRLHQIRRHLKHISCPLIGDVRYGKGEHNRYFREHHAFHRLALHCTWLGVAHPDGGSIAIDCALPADFARTLQELRDQRVVEIANAGVEDGPDDRGDRRGDGVLLERREHDG